MTSVLLDATALPADRGGVGRYVDALVAHHDRMGVQLHVVAQSRDRDHYLGYLDPDRVHVAPRHIEPVPVRLAWEQLGLPALVRRLRPNALFGPHYTTPLLTAGPRSVPAVVTLHDATFFSHPEVHTAFKRRFFTTWTRLSAGRAAALVVPSAATRDEVVTHTGADPARFVVIPHGVDHERFRPPSAEQVAAARAWAGVGPHAAYLAFLGTLEPRKNVPALVRAFVEVCRERPNPPDLVLAGGRGWDGDIEPAVAAVPDGLAVRRPGFIPDELVAGFLGGATAVVYPSLGEGFGLPVLEAMACGAPVLTTRLLALPEVGGDAVAYAASPAVADIAAALRRLLDDERWRADLREAGVRRAREFTWEASARAHGAVLARVARRGNPGGREAAR